MMNKIANPAKIQINNFKDQRIRYIIFFLFLNIKLFAFNVKLKEEIYMMKSSNDPEISKIL
jgi:hypothetical protein